MAEKDIALMAHLMRRAGFGAQYDELEARAAKGYEVTVEELLHPEDHPNGLELDLAERYFIEWNHFTRGVPEYCAFRMINSKNQLEEKMVLFWHGVLCTADSKVQSYATLYGELELFRRCGMGSFRELLVEISRDPAMVYFLDNCLSHKGAINENYGRELLELFSLGVGMDGQYNYFVADDAQVPAWMDTPPQDPETIKMLEDEYFRSGYNIRSMLRVLFNSDAFKNARFSRIKSPVEAVIGTLRLIGDWTAPKPGFEPIFDEMKHMGQELLNPPSVEGWHTGKEWIDGGTLVQRINYIADRVGDLSYPGIQDIIKKLASEGPTISPETLVDGCLWLLGHYELADETRRMLVDHARKSGELRTDTEAFPQQVGQMLQMIAATKEYLYA